jgi:hypothetical protein
MTETVLSDENGVETVAALVPVPAGGRCFVRLRMKGGGS